MSSKTPNIDTLPKKEQCFYHPHRRWDVLLPPDEFNLQLCWECYAKHSKKKIRALQSKLDSLAMQSEEDSE